MDGYMIARVSAGIISGFLSGKLYTSRTGLVIISSTIGCSSMSKKLTEKLQDLDEKKAQEYGYGLIAGVAFYLIYSSRFTKKVRQFIDDKIEDPNIIPIVHLSRSRGLFDISESSISLTTTHRFAKAYEKADPNKDIHLVIHTPGGSLSSVETIVNVISNHKGTGRIIAYIPYYAYSGGCAIALSCHEIVIARNAIVGPCDGQMAKGFDGFSISSIIAAVEHKKHNNEPIKEDWLARSRDAEICATRQKEFLDKLVVNGIMSETTKENVYNELFTGKYNHDTIFTPEQLIAMGLNITIVEQMPYHIMNHIDKE